MKTLKGSMKALLVLMVISLMLPLTAFANESSVGAKSTGMNITTSNAGTDSSQKIHVLLDFDKNIKVLAGANSDLQVALNGIVYPDDRVSVSVDSVNKNQLKVDIDLNFALYAGKLTIELKNATGITKIVNESDETPVQWSNVNCYVPNGVQLETVSSVIGNGTNNINAKIIKKVSSLGNVRGMVHIQLLKNGVVVPGGNEEIGGSVPAHYHNYLTITANSFASTVAAALANTFGQDYTFVSDGDKIIGESKAAVDGEILDVRVFAYPVDQQ